MKDNNQTKQNKNNPCFCLIVATLSHNVSTHFGSIWLFDATPHPFLLIVTLNTLLFDLSSHWPELCWCVHIYAELFSFFRTLVKHFEPRGSAWCWACTTLPWVTPPPSQWLLLLGLTITLGGTPADLGRARQLTTNTDTAGQQMFDPKCWSTCAISHIFKLSWMETVVSIFV